MQRKTGVLFYPKTEKENINKNLPMSLLKIGSEIKNAGFSVIIIDERFNYNYQEAVAAVIDDIVFFGVSSMTGYQILGGLRASKFIKQKNEIIPVVWGGWHPSILPRETLLNENIDIVAIGQGEMIARELAIALSHGLGLEAIDGIGYKKTSGIVFNRPRRFCDVNEFSDSNLNLLDLERYIFKGPLGDRTIFWNSSQGCPFHCGFCSTPAVYGRRWSGLSADRLLAQTEELVNKFEIDGITFAEDNFFVDVERVNDFSMGLLEKNIKINWATDARIDQINTLPEELMVLLRESGCVRLCIGAESGDAHVLKLIDKKITVDDTFKAAAKLDKYKIISEFFMIVGFPNDPEGDLKLSLAMIKAIKMKFPAHQFTPFLYTPYPGTPLFDLALKKGLRIPINLEGWQNWSILAPNTPWVNDAYLDKVNMYVKCFYPLAFPSKSLEYKVNNGYKRVVYTILHIVAQYRLKHDFFLFPVEWKLIKFFYRLRLKYNIFSGFSSFR